MDAAGDHVVLVLKLPDRPGALGAVASRIGAVGGDITDVTVASRLSGVAEDVFHVDLPVVNGCDMVSLLLGEIEAIEDIGTPAIEWPSSGCCALESDLVSSS